MQRTSRCNQMVMRYAHSIEEHKIEAMKKLEGFNRQKIKKRVNAENCHNHR
jgi:hypothetical protein